MGLVRSVATVLGIGLLTLPTAAARALPTEASTVPCANPVLASPQHGGRAVAALGRTGLARAAAVNAASSDGLAARLRADSTLWLDRCGKQFYVDQAAPASATPAATAAPTAGAPYPYDQTFALHSRPGSLRTIYLDFRGATISGTAWNVKTQGASFVAPPFSLDGDPTTFSTAEQDVIQSVWQRVSEDYAPFDVDVTTADPGQAAITRSSSTDQVYGTRLLVTNTKGPGYDCGCGGIAYVGVFDSSSAHDYYQPAFVFQPYVPGAKAIAEAAAHEVGHTLGLSHDGTATSGYYGGQGAWAPIMGESYYHPISQWSRGEYTGANNTEDDLSIIAAHGAAFRPDDHGDTAATATPLGGTGVATGVIGRPTDTDWFSFVSGGGATTITVTPAPVGPDLDASLTVRSSDGTVLATVDPPSAQTSADSASGLGATFTEAALPAGTYYVSVDGVGNGDPASTGYSDYASLGQYTLTVSPPPTTSGAPSTTTPPPTVTPPAVRVLTGAVPGATRDRGYSARLSATGGTGGFTWTPAAGTLPPGVTLSASGVLAGRPTTTGTYSFTAAVTDSGGRRATHGYRIRVAARPRVSTAALPAGRRHRGYAVRLAGAGGTLPYRWVVTAGRLPAGMSLTAAGTLRGAPRWRGTWTFTVTLIDHWHALGHRSYSIRVR